MIQKSDNFVIRLASDKDVSDIMQLMREFAANLGKTDKLKLTEEDLRCQIFENNHGRVLIAESNGHAIGFALYYTTFSSFEGRAAMYLEDIYITPLFRGQGYGKELMKVLSEICSDKGYCRLEWKVLKWNQKAIDFYHRIGAEMEMENFTFMQSV